MLFVFLSFPFSFCEPDSRNPTAVLATSTKLQGTLTSSIMHFTYKGCLKYIHLFHFFPHSLFHITRRLSCRTLKWSREVRGVTWEWQQMRRNEITRCLDITSACCAFSAKLLWQASQCVIFAPSLSFCHAAPSFTLFFRRLPFAIGWTLLRCQVPVFWEKGLHRLSFG